MRPARVIPRKAGELRAEIKNQLVKHDTMSLLGKENTANIFEQTI